VEAGDLISGKYRLQRLLGAGSMGSVWAARNELTNRDFAVKFLLPELSRNEEALNRFFLEARACGQIRNPAIVDVYDMGKADDGSPYLVMELLEGEGFDARIARQGRMRAVDVCRYIVQVARGLEEAHARGLIHRDLKPGNIFFALDKNGEVHPKVLDFGISKETSDHFDKIKTGTGAVLGSPAYMSPEQARGELDVDARTDIWALGVIMYEALSGELPFDANNYNALMLRIITDPHQPLLQRCPDVPPELSDLVDCLLQKDRAKRIGSAGELAHQLERIYAKLTDAPLALPERRSMPSVSDGTTHHSWLTRTRSGVARRTPVMMIGAAIGLFGILGGGFVAMRSTPAVVPVARFGSDVNAMVIRARTTISETLADKKAKAAEEAARAAEKRADEASKKSADRPAADEQPAPRASASAKRKPGDDPHGGVVGPGF
jgi:serine/threonine-protein kinase